MEIMVAFECEPSSKITLNNRITFEIACQGKDN